MLYGSVLAVVVPLVVREGTVDSSRYEMIYYDNDYGHLAAYRSRVL